MLSRSSCDAHPAQDSLAPAHMADAWCTFHQHEALTTRLRNILDEYPPGVGTLREYVQNADDAGASALVLCLDTSSAASAGADASGGFPTPALAEYAQVPSLLVYNDAVFSERDFESISSIGESRKRNDAATIGRYGLGFNVSYHLADVVQFVSRDTVVLFDPHGRALPGGRLGMRAKFTDGLGTKYPSLLEPMLRPFARLAATARGEAATKTASEVIDFAQPVDGTLFRLPLRTPAQASASELSNRAIAADDVRGLLAALCDANLGEMLLFTQNLCRIALCVLEPDGSLTTIGAASVQRPSSASAASAGLFSSLRGIRQHESAASADAEEASAGDFSKADAGLRRCRATLANLARASTAGDKPCEPSNPSPTVLLPTLASPLLFELSLCIEAADGTHTLERWLLCGGVHTGGESDLLCAALGQPAAWASVALPLHARPVGGRAFCFLPLPLATGLPCHVNGCFALTSNRRGLWIDDADRQLGDAHHLRKAQWNRLLCSEALPQLYAKALEQLALAVTCSEGAPADGWLALGAGQDGAVEHLATTLSGLLPANAEEGYGSLWHGLQRETLRDLYSRKSRVCVCYDHDDVLSLASFESVVVADASLACESRFRQLRAALSSAGLQVWAAAPGTVMALDSSLERPMRRAEPRTVCEWLSATDQVSWDRPLAAELLTYVLGTAAQATRGDRQEEGEAEEEEEAGEEEGTSDEMWALVAAAPLVGLRVVPLADNTLGPLHRTGRPERSVAQRAGKRGGSKATAEPPAPQYVIADDLECAALLSHCPVVILPQVLDEPGFGRLRALAQSRAFNITPTLDASALLQTKIMEHLLAPHWHGLSCINLRVAAAGSSPTAPSGASAAPAPFEEEAPTPAVASQRGWQPKGKFSGSKKASSKRPVAAKESFFKSRGHDGASSPVLPDGPLSVVELSEEAATVRLRLLWRLVDDAFRRGCDWGGVEVTRLEEWPTVLTSDGRVFSVSKARSLHVLRPTAFATDQVARAAMCRFGVAFAAFDAFYLNRRVCAGPEKLGAALEVAVAEKRPDGPGGGGGAAVDAATSLQLADCLALRGVVLDWCVRPSVRDAVGGSSSATDDTYAMVGLEVGDGNESPLASRRSISSADSHREASVQLPAAVLRKLPIFRSLDGQKCVSLRSGGGHASIGMIGTPSGNKQGAFEPITSMDDALCGVLGEQLLSYTNEEVRPCHFLYAAHTRFPHAGCHVCNARSVLLGRSQSRYPPFLTLRFAFGDALPQERVLLRLAEWPRPPPVDFVRWLSTRLRPSTRVHSATTSAATSITPNPLSLPLEALLLLLSAAAPNGKEIRLNTAERDELVRRLKEVEVVLLPSGERQKAADFVDPTDELLAQAMRAALARADANQGSETNADSEDGGGYGELPNDSGRVGVTSTRGLSVQLFPPASYTQSSTVLAGLRACGMRSLEEPAVFLDVAEGVAAAGRDPGSNEQEKSQASAVGRALFRLLVERWSKVRACLRLPPMHACVHHPGSPPA